MSAGIDFERRTRTDLESNGYWTMRAAGSHGAVDVLAIKAGQILGVQCKLSNPLIPPSERSALLSWASRCGGVPLVASRVRHGRGSVVVYRRLTGPEPSAWVPWVADEVAA